ncbi:MAG: autotransporter outer membrane beta-barrel domain-containing protein, partial [Emcibacter sp.]|nr:autotransporter outer membrane beta-barrel domain-containing protein [Emcibacter sp.]
GNKISIGLGGTGGTGGTGGSVNVNNMRDANGTAGVIITAGTGAHGILAMSIGGGGGTGSTVITSNVSLKAGNKSPTNSLAFSLGGNGGTGGTGGEVTVTNDIRIATYGQKSHGIIAQSIGGGGGNGGMSLSGYMVFGNNVDSTNAIAIAIGGTGGSGNTSRNVTVTNSGEIEVFGNGSYGVFAQSVGGGGGNGAFALALSSDLLSNPKTNPGPMFMNFGLGGAGGDGADSGDVIVNHTGSITAHGDDSYGIFAQSVAGGGGTVGFAISSPVWMATNAVVPLILGSRAGGSGTAGNVTVNTEGNITMLGNNSHAYLAQSVNGGGGNANLFLDFSQTARALGEDSVDIDDGSDQNGGGSGELAYIQAKIELGAKATGITAAGDFIATHTGNLITLGKNAFGSSTQSVGGGGGNANVDVAINEDAQAELDLLIGSQDTHNSGGGDITYQRTGDVGTTGDNSKGTSVQSIGGGGGDMIIAVRIVPDTPETSNTSGAQSAQVTSQVSGKTTQSVHKSQTTAKVAQDFEQTLVTAPSSINDSNASTLLAMGADSSLNNNGGAIILDFTGDTQTLGDRAPGMIIQSIGGGGGDVRLSGIENLSATFGGTGGTTGNGGNITLNNTGDILTTGTLSHGMVLQTIGGGGGTVLTDLAPENIGISTRSDNSGSGGDITFAQTGDITASGDRSIALLAQSLGGGGGILDRVFMNSAGGAGTSGNITLNIDGSMIATGTQGVAVFAQSIGADDQGDININLTQDKWMRGGTNGAGLWISGGNDNRFINHGIVITEDLVNGMAAYATTGNDRIDNYNLFYGRFDLGTGNNHFINHTGATFVPGSSLSLGSASNMLINDGTMLIADMGLAQRTDLTGSFTQSADALTYSELDFETGQLDQIRATGTVDVAGEVRLSLLNPHKIKSGDYSKILFSGELGLTNNGLILTTGSSRVLTYELLFPNATDATLHYEVNFAPAELGSNLSTMGNYFNSLQDAGSSPEMADVVSALLYIQDDDQFREALSQLSPDFYGEQQSKLMGNNARFGQSMMSCRQFGGEHHFTSEGNCVWIQAETEKTIRNAYGDFKASSASLNRFSVGMQKTYSHVWSLGFAASKSDTQAQGYNGNWNSSGRTTQLGLSMKYRTGGTKLAAVMSYGWNNTVTHRRGQLVGNFFTSVDRDLQVIGGLLRLSHDFDAHNRYFRPFIDFGLTHVMVKDATETGGGAISLVLPGHNETHTFFRPGMEIGTEHKLSQNIKLRFFANFSLQHNLSDSSTQAVAGFVGAPTSLDPMSVTIEVGQDMFQIQTGMDFIMPDNLSLRFQYSTTLHQQIKIRSGKVKLSLPF